MSVLSGTLTMHTQHASAINCSVTTGSAWRTSDSSVTELEAFIGGSGGSGGSEMELAEPPEPPESPEPLVPQSWWSYSQIYL